MKIGRDKLSNLPRLLSETADMMRGITRTGASAVVRVPAKGIFDRTEKRTSLASMGLGFSRIPTISRARSWAATGAWRQVVPNGNTMRPLRITGAI